MRRRNERHECIRAIERAAAIPSAHIIELSRRKQFPRFRIVSREFWLWKRLVTDTGCTFLWQFRIP